MKFTPAVRTQAKARLALTGPSGSGKTWGALLIARGLGERIAVIDTEHNSASLYAGHPDMPEFDRLRLEAPYTPERFIEALEAAKAAGYGTVLLDSITHEWNGSGGCLEANDILARAKFQGNTWSAWNETTPRHRKFLDAMLAYPGHVIVTLRSKTETAQEKNAAGRTKVVKLGMKSEQRDGFEYEMTVVLDIVHDGHFALQSKDRTALFSGRDPEPITAEFGERLRKWINSGAEVIPEPEPAMEASVASGLLALIVTAPDLRSLRTAYNTAFKAAAEVPDQVALDAFLAAKDARKAVLESAVATAAAAATQAANKASAGASTTTATANAEAPAEAAA